MPFTAILVVCFIIFRSSGNHPLFWIFHIFFWFNTPIVQITILLAIPKIVQISRMLLFLFFSNYWCIMSSVYSRQTILSPYYLKINSEAFNVGTTKWAVSRRSITMKIQTFSCMSTKSSRCSYAVIRTDCCRMFFQTLSDLSLLPVKLSTPITFIPQGPILSVSFSNDRRFISIVRSPTLVEVYNLVDPK